MFEKTASIADFLALWLTNDLLAPAEQETLNGYYAGYLRRFTARLQHYYRRQIEDVLRLMEARTGARVLEIGCGTGTESLWMAMHGAKVEAIELAKARFDVANARKAVVESDLGRKLACELVNGSLLDIASANQYDLVWMGQAFHHLEPRAEVVRKIAGLVKPGGHVVVSEANALNPLLQTQLFLQRGWKTLGEFTDESGRRFAYGNERILSAATLARLLSKAGFETVSIEHFRVFPNSPVWDNLLALERLVPRRLLPLFTHYKLRRQKEGPVSRSTTRKTIVFCGNSLWGLVNFRGRVIEALARDGHRVVLVAHPDIPVENVAPLGAEFVEWQLAPRGINPLREAGAVLSLWRTYRRLRPDLAFHFTIKPVVYGALVAMLARVRFISIVTGLGYLFLAENWRLRMAKALYRFTLRKSHEVWFLNADDREFFASHGLTAGVTVRTLPGEGVDLDRFARVPLPDSSERFVFLMIARLIKDKGVLEFGEAAARVKASDPRAVFKLLGPSYRANDMSVSPSLIDEWSSTGRIEYLGERDDVRPTIADSHCVVLPSYREGMPRVLMEAAAMGRPAITTDVAGCRDVVVDGSTGILCEARNADALADACLRMLSLSRRDAETMADQAYRSAAERFDARTVISIYRDVIGELVERSDPS